MFVIDDILLAPLNFTVWVAEKLSEEAKKQLTDDSKLQGDLYDLQIRRELEEISEEEYQIKETVLLKELDRINKCKEEWGM